VATGFPEKSCENKGIQSMSDSAGNDDALDAQAAAGALSRIFCRDVTTASAICAGCGRTGPFAELRLYGSGSHMGYVMRCPSCDAVLMRLAATPGGLWLEMQGLRSLTFATA
jgi:hypothetical protein